MIVIELVAYLKNIVRWFRSIRLLANIYFFANVCYVIHSKMYKQIFILAVNYINTLPLLFLEIKIKHKTNAASIRYLF